MRWVVMDKNDNIIEICDDLRYALEKYDKDEYIFVPELDDCHYLLSVMII